MNRLKFPILLTVFALAVVLLGLQPALIAQQNPASTAPSAQQQEPTATPPAATTQSHDAQTFVGTIAKSGGKYVLRDSSSKTTYTLDDQEKAKAFEGKNVKVTGMLDAQSNTIHVAAIEPAM